MRRLAPIFLAVAVTLASSPAAADDASDRAEIRELLARYVWALDGKDAESYAGVFTDDATLIYGGGTAEGRDTMRTMVEGLREREMAARAEAEDETRPGRGRHFMTNIVIDLDGDTAMVKDYWMHVNSNAPDRSAALTGFGHAENRMVRVDGEWLISYRRIYNEQSEDRWATDDNPSFVIPRD